MMSIQANPQQSDWTTTELSRRARCEPSLIRQYLLSGRISGIKRGSFWLIPDEEAQKFLNRPDGRRKNS
jgi:hypothetical protein